MPTNPGVALYHFMLPSMHFSFCSMFYNFHVNIVRRVEFLCISGITSGCLSVFHDSVGTIFLESRGTVLLTHCHAENESRRTVPVTHMTHL